VKIAIISDIHEDIISLQKALRLIGKYNCDEVICLGDICGFNIPVFNYLNARNASACIALLKENCKIVLAGNHDLFAIRKTPDDTDFFRFPEHWYSLDYPTRKLTSKGRVWLYEENELSPMLSDNDMDYLSSLTCSKIYKIDRSNLFLSHSIYPDLSGSTTFFPENTKDVKSHLNFITKNQCKISFSGHGHIQGIELCTENDYRFYSFTSLQLEDTCQWIACPCIARSGMANGFIVFDTVSLNLEVIELREY